MRSLLAWSACTLLLGASVIGCYDQARQNPAHATAAIGTTPPSQLPAPVINDRSNERGVTEAQPATPAARHAEAQPQTMGRLGEDRERVSQGVAQATQQIDRLARMEDSSQDPDRRAELEDALGDLRGRREKVLQDMRELELRGAAASTSASDSLREELYGDLGELEGALRDSYAVAPPPGSGMAPPAPLPPGPMH